jgi:hypothetical protein
MNGDQTRKASIIITTHNRPHLLPQAVSSARGSGTDVEIVVVDDASKDETANVCRGLSDIVYVRVERNQKVADARNVGLLASTGDFISFLDDDDLRLPQSLDFQIEALEATPEAALVYGRMLVSNQEGATIGGPYPEVCPQGDVFWNLLERNFIPCGAVVVRRSCINSLGLLDGSIPGLDDWDLWIRLAELYKVAAVERPVMIWREPTPGSGQGSSNTVKLIALSTRLLRQGWLKLPRAAAAPARKRREVRRRFSENVVEHLCWETARALSTGDLRHAGRSALSLLQLHPVALVKVTRRWARVSTLQSLLSFSVTKRGLENTKAHFKRARSGAVTNENSSV